MTSIRIVLMIAFCGALGAVMRYWLSGICYRLCGADFPYGTLAVNVLGCFALGLLVHVLQVGTLPESWRMPLAIGFLGSLTTFSTFGYETFKLLEDGNWTSATTNMGSNLALGLIAVWAGVNVGRMLLGAA